MSRVKVTLPGLEIPVTGKQVSFKAPCDCSSVECIQIDGVDYAVVDALGRQVTGSPKGGTWASGAQVSVILDCENKKAFLQNGNVTPDIIGAAYRPNLLHNWYFANPVNQRGKAEYKEVGYTVDRWYSSSESLTVTPTEEGLLLSAADSTAKLSQYIQIPPSAVGKECVLSLLMKDPSDISVTIDNPFTMCASRMSRFAEFSFTPTEGVETIKISIRPSTSSGSSAAEVTLIAAKLEIGSTQTLAYEKNFDALGSLYWELYETPDYHEEFMKCIQSTADPSDTYANKTVATTDKLCNPNLLHNWYFANPVNQRGQETYSSRGYTIDRWALGTVRLSVNIEGDGIRIERINTGAYAFMHQCLSDLPEGKYTFSILVANSQGAGASIFVYKTANGTGFDANNRLGSIVTSENGVATCTFNYKRDEAFPHLTPVIGFVSGTELNSSAKVIAAKLELGDTQTLARKDENGNWVLNEIPNYGDEFLKCIQSTADSSDGYANKVICHTGNLESTLSNYSRIATGSYVGTGTYGEANPVSIEFGFTPKMVTIYREAGGIDGGTWGYGAAVGMMYPCTYYTDIFGATEYRPEMVHLTWGDTSVSWYDSDNARQALNELNATYRWVAIY